jgi:hypothetical protein
LIVMGENVLKPEFNSTKKEKKSCDTFKQQGFLAFKNDIKRQSHNRSFIKRILELTQFMYGRQTQICVNTQ